VEVVKNLMVDAQTTSRWYFVISMGRKAGHLALGIGKSTGATLTLIPEEFAHKQIKFSDIVDILVGAIIKRLSYGKLDGVAIIAEGLVERLDPTDLESLVDVERDAHDNIRIAEINFGEILKSKVQDRLKEFGLKATIVSKNIGYELRCADPIPFDMEYTRDLGFSAAQFILDGGSGAMVSIQNGNFVPMYFKDIIDPQTLKTRIRMVDPASESFYIARRYMLRLNQADFDDPHELAKLAATAGISIETFKKKFGYLIENDLLYQFINEGKFAITSSESNLAHRLQAEHEKSDEYEE
jgi:6-phosphofructokinase 1